jgi:hypothetical protein
VLAAIDVSGSGSVAPNTFSLQYDAATSSYLLSTGSKSATFGGTNLLPQYVADSQHNAWPSQSTNVWYSFVRSNQTFLLSNSTPGLRVFNVVNGGNVDQLILSSNNVPIINSSFGLPSSDIVLSYVGFGSWFSGSVTSTGVSGSFDYFTYGAFTADSAMPRYGTGQYRYFMEGRLASPQVYFVDGQGDIAVNFSTGSIAFSGNINEMQSFGNSSSSFGGNAFHSAFEANATISAKVNNFSGTFNYNGSVSLSGPISGKFYGPGAQELGATFSASGSNAVLVGAIVGSLGGKKIQ